MTSVFYRDDKRNARNVVETPQSRILNELFFLTLFYFSFYYR